MKFNSNSYTFSDSGKFQNYSIIIGIIFLALSSIGYFIDSSQLFYSYLVSFGFWVSISLGALFFTMLHHLTGSTWSIVFRRFTESLAKTMPYLLILSIPIITIGVHDLYHWSHADLDTLLQRKVGYLNQPFFIIRTILYFAIWSFYASKLHKLSIEQDSSNIDLRPKMLKFSASGMILFALTLSFASFDWFMSTDAHWYSTMFGVYYFSASYLAIIVFLILVTFILQKYDVLNTSITTEHYHDLGKLLFGFTVFWGYIAGSQYFFIWYANIPEETIWYIHRWEGNWKFMSQLLIVGHFIIPFLILVFRASKRNMKILIPMAALVTIMLYVDIYWLVMPAHSHHGFHLSWLDLTTLIGIGGIVLGMFWKIFTQHAIIPLNDPNLEESLKFKNT
jgi:hypothetical protein